MSRAINSFAVLDDSDDEQQSPPTQTKVTNTTSSASNKSVSKPSERDTKNRRNPNNDRNTKGGRGPRKARDGKRTYDRRSGTGRGKEIKKDGGGARNWGSDKVDARKGEGDVDENQIGKEDEDNVNIIVSDEDEQVAATAKEPEIEEDKTMTMEEYLASKTTQVSLFGSSKGEKVVENEFEGKSARVSVEEDFLGKTGGKALRKKGSAKDKGMEKLDIDFRIKREGGDRDRDGGDRRTGRGGDRRTGRGGGRGRGGRGGRRGGRGINFALDTNAFPSL